MTDKYDDMAAAAIAVPRVTSDRGLDDVLTDLHDVLTEHVIFPSAEAAVAATVWAAATHTQRHAYHAPRLVVTSPTKRCGKSRLLDVLALASHRPIMTVNATVAAVFRCIDDSDPPTFFVDEADTIFGSAKVAENNEDLRGLFNAGHQRGRPAMRCAGPNHQVTPFPTFAMAAFGSIGRMPDTIMDRGITIKMRRRARGEHVKPFRHRRDAPRLQALGGELAGLLGNVLDAEVRDCMPVMHPLEDRDADTWEPLFAVASLAGGKWPDLVRQAAEVLIKDRDSDDGDEHPILADCRRAFQLAGDKDAMKTRELLQRLNGDLEAPWRDYRRGEGLSPRKLASLLSAYGVRSHVDRWPDLTQARGYWRQDFEDAWNRYCPSSDEGGGA